MGGKLKNFFTQLINEHRRGVLQTPNTMGKMSVRHTLSNERKKYKNVKSVRKTPFQRTEAPFFGGGGEEKLYEILDKNRKRV